jgi:hypothetical protein
LRRSSTHAAIVHSAIGRPADSRTPSRATLQPLLLLLLVGVVLPAVGPVVLLPAAPLDEPAVPGDPATEGEPAAVPAPA